MADSLVVHDVRSDLAADTRGGDVVEEYDITWSSVANATEYRIEESATSDFASSTSTTVAAPATKAPFTHSEVLEDTQYFYRVRAHNLTVGCNTESNVSPVVSLGPLAVDADAAGRPGLLLAGDAAGFVDPMTGDGLRFAIRGGELAARAALAELDSGVPAFDQLRVWRTREFTGKWRINRVLRALVGSPSALSVAALATRAWPAPVEHLVGVAGDVELARQVFRLKAEATEKRSLRLKAEATEKRSFHLKAEAAEKERRLS